MPHQGGGGRAGRARDGSSPDAQLRAHGRPRAGGGHEVPALPARRSRRLRDAGGRGDRGGPRHVFFGGTRRARGAHREDGTAAGDRRRPGGRGAGRDRPRQEGRGRTAALRAAAEHRRM